MRPSNEIIHIEVADLVKGSPDMRRSVDAFWPIRSQPLHYLARSKADSPGSQMAQVKSDLDCQIKETHFWEKRVVQKETEMSIKPSC